MREITEERRKRLEENGYTTVHIYKNLFLIRKYSRFCMSSFWKRVCPIYCMVKVRKEK